jgi:hypothetical protein
MNDTTPGVERWLRERYAALSGPERFLVGAEMFDSARTLVLASLPKGLAPEEARRRLCERFYGQEIARRVFGSRH